MPSRTKLYCSLPGCWGTNSGARGELWLKSGYRWQGDRWRDAGRVALELGDEYRHEVGVELAPTQAHQLLRRRRVRLRRLVRPTMGYRLVGIGHADDPRAERDCVAAQPIRIAAP